MVRYREDLPPEQDGQYNLSKALTLTLHSDIQESQTVSEETNIALDCPYCGESIYAPLNWFKKTYFTCPHCNQGLTAGQFGAIIAGLEEEMAASVDEMVHGQSCGGCCSKPKS